MIKGKVREIYFALLSIPDKNAYIYNYGWVKVDRGIFLARWKFNNILEEMNISKYEK